MRLLFAASMLALSTAAVSQTPPSIITQPSKLDPAWQAKTRALYETAVEIPTVSGRNQMPKQAEYLAGEFKTAATTSGDSRSTCLPHWRQMVTPTRAQSSRR